MSRAEAEPEGFRDDDALWVDCPECRDPSGMPTGEKVVNLSGVRVRSGPYAPIGPDPQEDHAEPCWRCEGTTRIEEEESSMNITVNVEDMALDSVIGSHRVQTSEDDYREEPRILADAVAEVVAQKLYADESWKPLRKRVLDIRDEEIRVQIAPIVAAAIAAPVQRTNSFGDPIGESTPLSELIVKEAQAALTRKVSYDGPTLTQKIIKEEVDRAIKNELSAAIADEKAKVVAAVRAKAADLIATAVREGVGR